MLESLQCGYCGRRTLKNSSFSPVRVAMVHQFLPSFEIMSSRTQRNPFLRANAPQIESSGPGNVNDDCPSHFLFACILHHIWHPTCVSLANTYIRHHLGALMGWRINPS